jgi:ferredoxin-NADP reductase
VTDPALPDLPSLPDLPALPQIGPVTRRPPPGGARRAWTTATVVGLRDETPRMRTYRLRLPSPVAVTPGQHLSVRLTAPDGYTASRSYSIASAPGLGDPAGSELELMVERLDGGEVSTYLHDELRVGDPLEVRGPFGGWFVWSGRTPALLVGGGSGVVPLMAMLRHRRAAGLDVPLRLLVSVRSPDDLPFVDEYGEETTVVYTRRTPPGWARPPGRVGADDLRPLLLPGATAYVCGSSGFAEHTSQLLVDLGVPAADVRVERYGAT